MKRLAFLCSVLAGLLVLTAAGIAQDSLNVRRLDQIMYAGTWHWAQDVAVVGERAYVARRQGGLAVENISDLDSLLHWDDVNPPC